MNRNLTEAPKREERLTPEIVLLQNGHPEMAIPMLEEKLAKEPGNWEHHVNIGVAYRLTNNFLLALLHQNLSVQIKPDAPQTWHNLGITKTEVGDFDGAFLACKEAYKLAPDHQQVCLAMAYALMREGKIETAWPLWEQARFQTSFFPVPGIKQWTGVEDLKGKKVIVTKEGGYGDSIFYLRWCSFLMDMGAEVYFHVWDKQMGIFKGHPWITDVIPNSSPIAPKEFDYCVSIMSLPALLGCKAEEIPCANHYIEARPSDIARFYSLVHRNGKPLVGICWGAEENGISKRLRTIPDEEIKTLRELPVDWISLWPGHRLPWMNEIPLKDWPDTAALVHHLDSVVSVDTAVLHLSGAMGKPTTAVVPLGSDWKWFRKGEDSPFYPSMKVIRNDDPVSWKSAIEKVKMGVNCGS
jgi:hypothetical protein